MKIRALEKTRPQNEDDDGFSTTKKRHDEQTVGNQDFFFQWFNKTSPYISASQSRPAVYLLLLLCQAHERKEFYEKMGRAVNRIWSTVT